MLIIKDYNEDHYYRSMSLWYSFVIQGEFPLLVGSITHDGLLGEDLTVERNGLGIQVRTGRKAHPSGHSLTRLP